MRFLKEDRPGKLTLTEDLITPPGSYAILSHTWGADRDEATFEDLQKNKGKKKAGYKKLKFCLNQARNDGFEYVWVDTCCINKANNVELYEAILSMFQWYAKAAVCYVYLSDLTVDDGHSKMTPQCIESAFRQSKWFTRGWTLQELLAPKKVEFYSQDGHWLGNKTTLEHQIQSVTGIPVGALRGESLSKYSFDERFRWAEKRTTKKIDRGQSLLSGWNFQCHYELSVW